MKRAKCQLLLFFTAAGLQAQTLHVPSTAAAEGKTATFSMQLEAGRGKALLALQLDLAVPPAVRITTADIKAGKAAADANKLVTCAASSSSSAVTSRFTCILAGGSKAIADGPLLTVTYRAEKKVGGAPVRVGIEKVVGVSEEGGKITLPDASAIIQIH